ncbi:hypothetical protein AWZ03_003525 [Drosophila navojoa]|uniref:Uncharacterized protein n=1 Tax=Drosophila navojoa TaxID=7232 RepID=A0A484BQ51_DRONA|nr:hypothetical protein AWZ03_003525 [Drosophila navojoa]
MAGVDNCAPPAIAAIVGQQHLFYGITATGAAGYARKSAHSDDATAAAAAAGPVSTGNGDYRTARKIIFFMTAYRKQET